MAQVDVIITKGRGVSAGVVPMVTMVTNQALVDMVAVRRCLVLVFVVVCVGFILSTLGMVMVNVAFPAVEHDFRGGSTVSLSWILSAYSIVFAALLVLAGRLADRSSRRDGFLLGVVFSLWGLRSA